ncbi:MAG: histidine kinase, partial [Saprospiraceae bacterium]|nr:histidine kinase [Saprospiraceae bacterium]
MIEHHHWVDFIDKGVLILTAFFITFSNLLFQSKIQSKTISLSKIFFYTFIINALLFGANLLMRLPFWNMIPFHKPPLLVFGAVDLVRSLIIALVSYWVISFLNKNSSQVALQLKLNELENQTLQLQLKNLTAQLQPHFFFNSLNVLSELIHIDQKKSDKYIQRLSNIFRYVLIHQDTPIISLTDEINFIKSYLFLLKIRFDNSVEIKYNISSIESYIVPSLCSIIVLENIVKHNNIENLTIIISISNENKELIISNTKNRKSRNEVKSMGLGLTNIDKKCQLLLHKSI